MDEYINKRALLGIIDERNRNTCNGNLSCLQMKRMIEEIPSADVAPLRHGKWLKAIDNDCEMHRCDQCGARVVKELYEYENPNRYCYHCGARMDLGGNDNA